jgi:hypothetical protein
METGQLESLPEIIECSGIFCSRGSWPNITGTKFTGTIGFGGIGPYEDAKKYSYTFNNLGNKKVSFCLELYGQESEYLVLFKIDKITTKK